MSKARTLADFVADNNEYANGSIEISEIASLQTALDAKLDDTDVGVTVQGYDADTAKLDVAQTFTATQTFSDPVLGTPTSGQLSNCTVDGTDAVGFRNTPVNSKSEAYTLVLADSGKTILHPIADDNARTFTIPANSSVAYPVGTVVTFVNLINDVTIAITDDTMYLAGDGTTGSRTLAAYGVASAVKVASTSWIISGNGLT